MNIEKRHLTLGVAILAGLLAVGVPEDAEARRGRGRRPRRNSHFRSLEAPARSKTPALNSEGGADLSGAPVANGAVEGDFRQGAIDGGTLLAMSADRALILNSYRGLSLVDTSDPSAPAILASVELPGSGERMFLGDGEVTVLSGEYGENGTNTVVTSIVIGASSLTVAGSVSVEGSLVDAAREGDELTIVTTEGWYYPMYASMDAEGGPAMGGPDGNVAKRGRGRGHGRPSRPSTPSRPTRRSLVAGPDWYGGSQGSHVSRVSIGTNDIPVLLGTADLLGSVVASAVSGDDAVVAMQSYANMYVANGGAMREPMPWYQGPAVTLVRMASGADGAPVESGTFDLSGAYGVSSIDRDGSTVRLLEWTEAGQILATFALGTDTITAQDSFVLGDWPSAFAFSGGSFVYGMTEWNYDDLEVPGDPVFDPDRADGAFLGQKSQDADATTTTGPASALYVVDVSDPSNIVAGGSIDIGRGWIGGLVKVEDGVVLSSYDYDYSGGEASTVFQRISLADPANPAAAGDLTLGGYASIGPVLGDLMLLSSGVTNEDGSFIPQTTIANLASGGLEEGGSFGSPSWTSAADREGDLLGLASYDRLTLVSLSDVENPEVLGDLRLIVNVAGFAALNATTGAALTTDYLGGDVEIRTVSLPSANALTPLDTLRVATGDAQMFAAGSRIYVVATDWSTGRASVTVVDASDPQDLRLRGSLDLASYPGQVFLKGNALLLLRQAYTLFEYDESGDAKSAADAFGQCPESWLRDELTSVLDVVDLSDPDNPVAGGRLRMRWDYAGEATLAGDSLYIPSYFYATLRSPDAADEYVYQIREVDLSDPLHPQARRAVDVPGTLVAATNHPHQVLTASYTWDENSGTAGSTLHLVDLSQGWQTRVLASRGLDGYPESVTVGGGHVYVVTESWTESGSTAQLATLDLSTLDEESSVDRDRGAWIGEIDGSFLFLRTWGWTGAIDVYSLETADEPSFLGAHEVAGWGGDITVTGSRAYLAGGLYGVQSFSLSD